jgi:hypothetical protein
MSTPLKSATIFFQPGTKRPRKYRNISTPYSFESFARSSGAWYINFYDQATGKFTGRKWLVNNKK